MEVDGVTIKGPLGRKLLSKAARKIFRDKTGIDADIQVRSIDISVINEGIKANVDAYIFVKASDVEQLLQRL